MCYTQNAQQIPGPSGQKGENATSILGVLTLCSGTFVETRLCFSGAERQGGTQTSGKRHNEDSGNGKSSKVQRQSNH